MIHSLDMLKTIAEVEAFLQKEGLDRLSNETAEATVIRESNTLEPGAEYTFDIVDEDNNIVAGEKPYGTGVVRYLAASKAMHIVPVIASQLWRVAYPTDSADAKVEPVCEAAATLRTAFRGLTFSEILGSDALVGKTIKCTGIRPMFVKADRDQPFGPENAEPRNYPVFEIL